MWPPFVVLDSSFFDFVFCVFEVLKQVNVQTLVGKSSVESLDVPVLSGFPGTNEKELHSVAVGPLIELPRSELRTIVNADRFRNSPCCSKILQNVHHIVRAKSVIEFDPKTFSTQLIDQI